MNLDADLELGSAGPYAPTQSVKLAMGAHIRRLASSLLAEGDVLVDEDSTPKRARGLVGRAFCPTPRALRILERSGAEPEPHPSLDVLLRVNSRAFASDLGTTLPGAVFARDLETARATLAQDPPVGHAWRVKYAYGMTGRYQRVLATAALAGADLTFVAQGFARRGGGVQIEPDVAIEVEYAIHGWIERGEPCQLGVVLLQRCDRRGAWVSSERLDPRDEGHAAAILALTREGQYVGENLARVGYFGPFGVDAYSYRHARGAPLRFQPRSEINARYSMAFAIGLSSLCGPRR